MFFGQPSSPVRRSIACLGLDWKVESSLKTLLSLLQKKTTASWHLSHDVNADVILYAPESPLAQALLRRVGQGNERRVMVACLPSNAQRAENSNTLTLPIGASKLLNCLIEAERVLSGTSAAAAVDQDSLCARLYEALHESESGAVALVGVHSSGLLLRMRKLVYWSRLLDADTLAQLLLEPFSVKVIPNSPGEIEHHIATFAPYPQSSDALLWAIGTGTSGGRLLASLSAEAQYRITRWPDFGLIGRRASDIRCAALLSQRAYTPIELSAITGFPLPVINNFLNACALSGLLEAADVKSPKTVGITAATTMVSRPLFQRIREALAIGI